VVLTAYGGILRSGAEEGWAAGLAALLWVVDDARAMPSGWVSNRNALLAILFGLLAVHLHRRWRLGAGPLFAALATISFSLALFSAEAGIGATAYLFAFACFLDPEKRWKRRLASLAPYTMVVILWRIAYQILGFGADGGLFYLDPVRQPLEFSRALLGRLPMLFLGQWGLPPAESSITFPAELKSVVWVAGLMVAGGLAWAFRPLLRADSRARFFALGMALAFLPICAVQPGDRNLGFVGFGAAGLLALFLTGIADHSAWARIPVRLPRARRAIVIALIGIHLVLAPLLFPLMTFGVTMLGEPVTRAAAAVAIEELPEGTDLVLVNAPDFFYADMVAVHHGLAGQRLPRSVRPLALGPTPIEVTRLDETTLEMKFEDGMPGGMFAGLFRGPDTPLEPGDRIEMARLLVEVESITDDGWIGGARFRFDRPLESPELSWLCWETDHYVPFTPPPVGARLELAPAWSPFEARIHGALGGETSPTRTLPARPP